VEASRCAYQCLFVKYLKVRVIFRVRAGVWVIRVSLIDSVVWYMDVPMAAVSIGGGDWKWLCMPRVQSHSVPSSCL